MTTSGVKLLLRALLTHRANRATRKDVDRNGVTHGNH